MTLFTPLFLPFPRPFFSSPRPLFLPLRGPLSRTRVRNLAMTTGKSALVSPTWLASQSRLTILDASWYMPSQQRDAHAEYLAEHIPKARYFDIDGPGLADSCSPFPHMLPSPEEFQSAVSTLGVASSKPVVVYAKRGFVGAARAWWMFRVFGKEDVFVLDGGLEAWKNEGRSVESGEESHEPTSDQFVAKKTDSLVKTMKEMLEQMERQEGIIIDARAQGRFDGVSPEPRPGLLKGHMPGAFCVPSGHLVATDGKLRPVEQLKEKFRDGGLDEDMLASNSISLTCGSGVTAAITCLALHELGITAAVYDGSWSEYGSHTDNPVAQNL